MVGSDLARSTLGRANAVDGAVRWQHGPDDGTYSAANDCADRGACASATEEPMGLPARCSNSRACSGTDTGSEERVAQAMIVLHQFDGADVLPGYGLFAGGVGEGDRCFGNFGEES